MSESSAVPRDKAADRSESRAGARRSAETNSTAIMLNAMSRTTHGRRGGGALSRTSRAAPMCGTRASAIASGGRRGPHRPEAVKRNRLHARRYRSMRAALLYLALMFAPAPAIAQVGGSTDIIIGRVVGPDSLP